ncbi:class F sortase [Nocardioides sp. WV_118_6]
MRYLVLALATVAALLPGPSSAAPAPAPAAADPAARATTCATTASSGIRPVGARFDVLGREFRVVRVRRTASGAIGTPPVTKAGKKMVGWDRQVRPGAGVGSVILDAHTWPDGSALGNSLLSTLRAGHTFSLRAADGRTVCYRVHARRSYPAARVPRAKAFRDWGSEQAVIVVCSGRRLGPGKWTRRTVWYAVPLAVVPR